MKTMPNQNEESGTPRQYKDVAGNPVTLDWLVRNEPEWAANQIRHRDRIKTELILEQKKFQYSSVECSYISKERDDLKTKLAAANSENDRAKECLALLLEHAGGYQTPNHIEGWEKAVALAKEILSKK